MSQLEKKILLVLMPIALGIAVYFLLTSLFLSNKSPVPENYIFNKPEFISRADTEDKQYSVRFYTGGKVGDIVRRYLALFAKDAWDIREIKTVGNYNTILVSRPTKDDAKVFDYLIVQIDGGNATDARRGVTLTSWVK